MRFTLLLRLAAAVALLESATAAPAVPALDHEKVGGQVKDWLSGIADKIEDAGMEITGSWEDRGNTKPGASTLLDSDLDLEDPENPMTIALENIKATKDTAEPPKQVAEKAPKASYTIPTETCTEPLVRKPWHALSPAEKKAYIDAEVCLQTQPSRLNDPSSKSLYFDLVKAHQIPADRVHHTGLFLPFHRFHMTAHETLLRTACGYKGAQPYWDESFDAGAFSKADLFKPQYFGGNGAGPDECVQDGPFAKFTVTIGPFHDNVPRCLSRKIDDKASEGAYNHIVQQCLEIQEWSEALKCIGGHPHNAGHNGVGGIMSDGIASPGDPLYYLHHTWLDRVWYKWQQKWGTDVKLGTWVEGREVFAGDELDLLGLVESTHVGEIAEVGKGRNCFVYL